MTTSGNKARGQTAAQKTAVDSTSQKLLIIAGPGSGKTATLVARIRRLIANGVPPVKIAALTFTNAAAREIERRLATIDGGPIVYNSLGYCGTLHGFALRCLKKYGGLAGYGERLAVVNPEGSETLLESKNRQIGNAKRPMKTLLKLKELGRPKRPHLVDELVVASYFDELRDAGLVDFDVLLAEFARCLEEEAAEFYVSIFDEFEHLFVDEVQDSGTIDWRIYRALPIRNKFLVGDPDQSIYSFRGAALEETIACAKDPAWEVIKLEENFRSLSRITDAAQRLIEHNLGRVDKKTKSACGVGGLLWWRELENPGDEVAEIANQIRMELAADRKPEAIAVLTRTNAIANEISKALDAQGIPVAKRVEANLPPDLGFIRSLITYLCNPENDTLGYLFAVARQINLGIPEKSAKLAAHELRTKALRERKSINSLVYGFPKNLSPASISTAGILGTHNVTAEGAMFIAEKLRDLPDGALMIELAHALNDEFRTPEDKATADAGVKVMTLHASKGREFDVVFLAAFEDEGIPGRRQDVDVNEERRLAYVGITRARRAVHFTSAKTRHSEWKGIERRTPSRFSAEAKQ
jgi:DNA helicase-2/ATP-dependent DNA helicase PcrA